MDLWKSRNRSHHDVFDARLSRGGDGYGVSVATQTRRSSREYGPLAPAMAVEFSARKEQFQLAYLAPFRGPALAICLFAGPIRRYSTALLNSG